MPYTNRYYENQGTGQEYGREGVFGDLRAQNRATQEQRGMARRQGAMYGPGSEGFGDAGRRLSPEAAQQQIATSRDYFANPSAYQGGSAMSRFANRQSPNQQAKIASMMESTMGNKRLLPPSPINPPNYPRAIGGPALRDEDLRNLQTNPPNPALRDEDMRGLITNPTLADKDIGRYEPPTPGLGGYEPPTPPETGIGRYDRDRVPDRARRKVVVGEAGVTRNPEPYYDTGAGRVTLADMGGGGRPEPNREPYYDTGAGRVTLADMGGGGSGQGYDPRIPVGPGYMTSEHLTPDERDMMMRTGFHEQDGFLYSLGPDGVLFWAGHAPSRDPHYDTDPGRVTLGDM